MRPGNRHPSPLGQGRDEELVVLVDQALPLGQLFVADFGSRRAGSLELSGPDHVNLDAQLFRSRRLILDHHEGADRSDDRRAVGIHGPGLAGDGVGGACPQVLNVGPKRFAFGRLGHFVDQVEGAGNRSPGRINHHQNGGHLLVFNGVANLPADGHRGGSTGQAGGVLHEWSVQFDQGHVVADDRIVLVAARRIGPGPLLGDVDGQVDPLDLGHRRPKGFFLDCPEAEVLFDVGLWQGLGNHLLCSPGQ